MDKQRVGIIGLGWVAQVFHLPILASFKDIEVTAVCDRNQEQSRAIASRFNIPSHYNDYEKMLKEGDFEAVIVCTSTDAHLPVAKAVMESGRDVFVEKPVARLYNEAVELAEIAKAQKRKLMVGMNNRFRPDTMILKSFIEKGELGKVFYCKAGWFKRISSNDHWLTKKDYSGGGVLLDLGIVMLDLALWMLNFPSVNRVKATTFKHKTHSVEDSALLYVEAKQGASIMIETSWSFQSENDFFYCDFMGSEGSAKINPLRINKQLHGSLVNVTPAKIETPQNLHKKSYENEIRHFLGAVRGLHPVLSTVDEAVKRMAIVEAAYRSAKLGREVLLK
jgi:predicted dehydrogenase